MIMKKLRNMNIEKIASTFQLVGSRILKVFYHNLLDAGVDIIWANHAHIIKDRKIVIDKNGAQKIIMYANGNTISGQRTNPTFTEKNVDLERDNTGDGLLYLVELKKSPNKIQIKKITPIFITTYIISFI